ncbi:MAG: phosphomannomutase/phosphoglucomutase [Armatimonadetes bacterium]|nr:phosphomannomutase/phosphoglucomutase [Armatimonadota bacterium]
MAKVSPLIFRQYDIRGIAGNDINPEVARLIGLAYGTLCRRNGIHQVVVGHDNRKSSPEIQAVLVEGLISTGCNVVDIGEVITPLLYFACRYWQIDGGVMVTASHNPPQYNGFKLVWGHGTLFGEQIQKLRQMIEDNDFEQGNGSVTKRNAFADYFAWVTEHIKLGERKLKVVVDCGNGTASHFAPKLLSSLGCEVVELYCESDPTFPNHLPDPVKPENLRDLIAKVREVNADVGLGFDGDGDRLGVVDEQGNILWGDQLMILFSREVLQKHPGAKIIVEVKCSQAVIEDVAKHNGVPILWRTGHSFIKAKMHEEKALLAGEMSGHLFFADEYFGYDDALYAACRLLRILSHTEKSLSELLADVPKYHATPEVRVHCDDTIKFEVVAKVVEHFKQNGYEVIDVDGARVVTEGGWALVRASNTEPALILRAEGKTPEGLKRLHQLVTDALKPYPEVQLDEWLKVG